MTTQPITQFTDDYLNEFKQLRQQTRTSAESSISRFFRWVKQERRDEDVTDITEEDVRRVDTEDVYAFFHHLLLKDMAGSTLHTYRYRLRQFFSWATEDHLPVYGGIRDKDIEWSVIDDLLPSASARPAPPYLEYGEVVSLLQATDEPKQKAIIMLTLKTSLRPKPLAELKMQDIDMETLCLHHPSDHTREPLLFDDECATILKEYLETKEHTAPDDYLFTHKQGGYTVTGIRYRIRQSAEQAGYPQTSAHNLRHTFKRHYMYPANGTEQGTPGYVKQQMGLWLDTLEQASVGDLEARREEYDRVMPNYL